MASKIATHSSKNFCLSFIYYFFLIFFTLIHILCSSVLLADTVSYKKYIKVRNVTCGKTIFAKIQWRPEHPVRTPLCVGFAKTFSWWYKWSDRKRINTEYITNHCLFFWDLLCVCPLLSCVFLSSSWYITSFSIGSFWDRCKREITEQKRCGEESEPS